MCQMLIANILVTNSTNTNLFTPVEIGEQLESVLSKIFIASEGDSYFKELITETGELSIEHICKVSQT